MTYRLEDNIGFILRQATQRHLALFGEHMAHELTPTQFSALFKLHQEGSSSQNRLGRLTAMDNPTIKGVVDRLIRRSLAEARPDPNDARQLMLSLTAEGERVLHDAIPCAERVTAATLAPLAAHEQAQLLLLLQALR